MHRVHDLPFGVTLIDRERCRFRVWAPAATNVRLRLGADDHPMDHTGEGWWECSTEAGAGMTYGYVLEDGRVVPDPAARAQAEDVHGPSVIVDPHAYDWRDGEWRGRPWEEAVIYELHVGCFSPSGDFKGLIQHLDYLVELHVTAIELMPVADFPGRHDWGYDGVLSFAPDRRYGDPELLKSLVDAAHARGLMVLLDVVYNHFGPEGNYLHLYAPAFFSERHHTPWGAAINFDGEHSRVVRDFFIHNALYWLEEYHFDGLRLDAVHAIIDDSQPDLLEELASTVHACLPQRQVHLVLENDHNAAHYLRPGAYRAQWNDDFHHCMHVILTGEEGGYYEDFAQRTHAMLARSLAEGFAFQGEFARYHHGARGEPSSGLPAVAFVNFLQNHDQIGNRAFGERLSALAEPDALRAATVLLLLAPAPPLLFMGQEWGSEQPFPFFCDFGEELAPKVTEGRRREFARFPAFADPKSRERIPDPQAQATFDSAVLRWEARMSETGADWLQLHRGLLALRQREIVPRLRGVNGRQAAAEVFAETGIAARWRLADGQVLLFVANLGAEPIADVVLPSQGTLYATPELLGDNGTLAPWGVSAYLVGPADAVVQVAGARLWP